MNIHGWCTECRRVKVVNVSNSGMASLAAGGIAQGVCSSCRQASDDLRRSEPLAPPGCAARDRLAYHVEFDHERELPPGLSPREVRQQHDLLHRRQRWDHRHVGPDDRIIRTR